MLIHYIYSVENYYKPSVTGHCRTLPSITEHYSVLPSKMFRVFGDCDCPWNVKMALALIIQQIISNIKTYQIRSHACMPAHTPTRIHARMHANTHTRTHTRMLTCTSVHVCAVTNVLKLDNNQMPLPLTSLLHNIFVFDVIQTVIMHTVKYYWSYSCVNDFSV
jgi:hypothetical protein